MLTKTAYSCGEGWLTVEFSSARNALLNESSSSRS